MEFFICGGSSVIADSASLEERGRVQGIADFCIFSFVALASCFLVWYIVNLVDFYGFNLISGYCLDIVCFGLW